MGGGDEAEVKETETEKTNAQIALARRKRYVETFKPLVDEWLAKQQAGATAGERMEAEGMATTGIARQSADVSSRTNPGAAPSVAAIGGLSRATGTVGGSATSKINANIDDRDVRGLMAGISYGNGQAVDAIQSMSSLAGDAVSEGISGAQSEYDTHAAQGQAIGTAVGMGLSMYRNGGKAKPVDSHAIKRGSGSWYDPDGNL